MPEMPEVETIRRQLSGFLPLRITSVVLSKHSGSIIMCRQFGIRGKTILGIRRKGKMLNFMMDNGGSMLSQLGMSGSWQISETPVQAPHAHVQLRCRRIDKRFHLAYVDPRRFGNIFILNRREADDRLGRMGVDVASRQFTGAYLYRTLQAAQRRVLKPFLLDQSRIAGIGNYMASELCARAGVDPSRTAGSISREEAARLVKGCKAVVRGSLRKNGLTFHGGYVDATGARGEALSNLVVFHQERCGMCGTGDVVRTILAGRATFHCPLCQH